MRQTNQLRLGYLAILLLTASVYAQHHTPTTTKDHPEALQKVAAIHGQAGPFAVAGYRMGARALQELGISSGDFALDVTHYSPAAVQWSCMADGLQAATGTSAGKLNLHLTLVASRNQLRSVVRHRKTKQMLTFHLRESFVRRFLNVPYEKLVAAGEEVLQLPDDEIFTFVADKTTKTPGRVRPQEKGK